MAYMISTHIALARSQSHGPSLQGSLGNEVFLSVQEETKTYFGEHIALFLPHLFPASATVITSSQID